MTRRSSVRAQARANYRALVEKAAVTNAVAPLPEQEPATGRAAPAARPGGGRGKEAAGGENEDRAARGRPEQSLTDKVRALYEDSAVPVREIAAIAGVSERTIYKYAAKGGWTKRYRVLPRGHADESLAAARGQAHEDVAAARAPRSRRAPASPAFAPVRGAGARFIRRDDSGAAPGAWSGARVAPSLAGSPSKPFATGLKATDPAGHARAIGRCAAAAPLAALALATAEGLRARRRQVAAIDGVNRALAELRLYRQACLGRGRVPAAAVEAALLQVVAVAAGHWEKLLWGNAAVARLDRETEDKTRP